jgi:hypothetical protein
MRGKAVPTRVIAMTDSTISCEAGGLIGVVVGFVATLSMAIGRREWRMFVPRLVGGCVGGALGGMAGVLVQAFALPEPYAILSVLNFGTILLVAFAGSILGFLLMRVFGIRNR